MLAWLPALFACAQLSPLALFLNFNESLIRDYRYEMGIIVTPDGRQLVRNAGYSSHVRFSQKDFQLFRGNIITHNHPNNFCDLSPADWNAAIRGRVLQFRAVCLESVAILDINDHSLSSAKARRNARQIQDLIEQSQDDGRTLQQAYQSIVNLFPQYRYSNEPLEHYCGLF